jgi:hypothetical protein
MFLSFIFIWMFQLRNVVPHCISTFTYSFSFVSVCSLTMLLVPGTIQDHIIGRDWTWKIHQKHQYRQLFGLVEIQSGHILNKSHKSTTELTNLLFELHFLQPSRLHHLPRKFFSCSTLHILPTSRFWKLLGDELSSVTLCISSTSLWCLEFSVLLSVAKAVTNV